MTPTVKYGMLVALLIGALVIVVLLWVASRKAKHQAPQHPSTQNRRFTESSDGRIAILRAKYPSAPARLENDSGLLLPKPEQVSTRREPDPPSRVPPRSGNPTNSFSDFEAVARETGSSMTPRDAELAAALWMKCQGCTSASASRVGPDGGIDVSSSRYVAQVKHRQTTSDVRAVREIFGVAQSQNKQALFFSLSGYTAEAVRFGSSAPVALFRYDTNFSVAAASPLATQLLREGLHD